MDEYILGQTKKAAYFLWEYTFHEDPMVHWTCAEDIACFFEGGGIVSTDALDEILRLGKYHHRYIDFMRHIAFRIYIYTHQKDAKTNWYAGERLVANGEWRGALANMARIYRQEKNNADFLASLRSEKARRFYS